MRKSPGDALAMGKASSGSVEGLALGIQGGDARLGVLDPFIHHVCSG